MPEEVAAMPSESAEDRKRREQFETEDDLRTLTRAIEIRRDDTRMARVRKLARKQIKDLRGVGKNAD